MSTWSHDFRHSPNEKFEAPKDGLAPTLWQSLGRFEPHRDPVQIFAVLRDVLLAADAERPEQVTQRAYNEARARAGHPGSPRADHLTRRTRASWAELRAATLDHPNPPLWLATRNRKLARRVLTRAEAVEAIKRAAKRRGSTTLTLEEYEVTRQELNAAVARRHTHGRTVVPLPEARVITNDFNFISLVKEAGLEVRPKKRPALDRAIAVVVFVEHFGFCPSQTDLKWFGRHNRIQLVGLRRQLHAPSVERARARFDAEGRWFPPDETVLKAIGLRSVPRPHGWESYAEGSEELERLAHRYPRQRPTTERYTLDEVRAAVSKALDLMPPGQQLTVHRYRRLPRTADFPTYKTVHDCAERYGTSFRQLVIDEVTQRARDAGAAHQRLKQ